MHSDVIWTRQFHKLWKQTSLLLDNRSGEKTLILKTNPPAWPDGTVMQILRKQSCPAAWFAERWNYNCYSIVPNIGKMGSDMLHLLSSSLIVLHFIPMKDVPTILATFPVAFCRVLPWWCKSLTGWDTMCFSQMTTLDGVPALPKKPTQPSLSLETAETVKTVDWYDTIWCHVLRVHVSLCFNPHTNLCALLMMCEAICSVSLW